MSGTNDYAQRRRDDRAVAAEQARKDAAAAADRALRAEAVRAELAERRRTEQAARRAEAKAAAGARAAARRAAAGAWIAAHRVDLLIYPLAVASAAMAIPAMATYGMQLYGGPTGAVLPVLSELGMWAFALAVQSRRRQDPAAPVWSLQVGVWSFAAVAAGLNLAHGLDAGLSADLVMGVVSVAGVVAHQLVTAGPRRPRRARRTREQRAADRKTRRARRAALDAAVAEIDADGGARLVIAPGTYRIQRGRFGRVRLAPHTTPGLPVADGGAAEDLAAEIGAWLAEQPSVPGPSVDDAAGGPGNQTEEHREDGDRPEGHGVGTLDRPAGRPARRRTHRVPRARSLDQLRAELAAAIASGEVDPSSAESIRTTLRCAPARARALRDEHTTTTDTTTDQDGDQR
ncbi:hypothetical protein [Pseudonocardia sp. Ae505_Ps2]|uniref:hypothetical protein n=1 Tax=Pseudonocardia sp. Ae505_Ps2 TaxID=1885034 RepID=UPI00094EE8C3|nr:hypothetical protein [Pseudonocardia sp. Ae505_Ps2]OLM12113.1 hypothetical protein Ae505Ps2_2240 [Pseudonocardia sp. Ae505_Ps2]